MIGKPNQLSHFRVEVGGLNKCLHVNGLVYFDGGRKGIIRNVSKVEISPHGKVYVIGSYREKKADPIADGESGDMTNDRKVCWNCRNAEVEVVAEGMCYDCRMAWRS